MSFHPFQGRPSFGLSDMKIRAKELQVEFRFHPFQGRPSFGLIEKGDVVAFKYEGCFHPFQGRPSFGQIKETFILGGGSYLFPSLSGKTFIRTRIRVIQNCRQFG